MSSQYFQKDSYVTLVKTIDSYGINIINSYSDFDLIGKHFNSNPLVYFYDSNSKVVFDYSNTKSTEDFDLLKILLQGLNIGSTFEIKNGYYVKEQDGITSNINGIYEYDFTIQNSTDLNYKMFVANVVSAPNLNTNEYRYERDYFVDTVQIDLNRGFTGDESNIIKCVLHEGVINELGLYPGDLIEISYTGITQNVDRYKIEKVETSDDGEEFIFVNQTLTSENRIGKQTTLNIYNRGNPPLEYNFIDKTIIGSAKIFNSKGVYVACYDNQNQLQAYLRKYNTEDPNSKVFWGYDTTCNGVPENSFNISQGQNYQILVDVKVEKTSTSKNFLINGNSSPILNLQAGLKYLFYQGHSSNYDSIAPNQLVFTRVKGSLKEEDLLTDFYAISGYPGNYDSAISLNVTTNIPITFYYECLNHPNMGGAVVISGIDPSQSLDENSTIISIGQYSLVSGSEYSVLTIT